MTVAAVNAVIAHMVFVAKLHRLRTRNILPREIRRARQPQHSGQSQSSQEYSRKQTKPGDKIRAAVKNLGHVKVALWRVSEKGAGNKENPPSVITGRVLARVEYDAIVSNKSFRIATTPRRKILFARN
jgi:hypothetical protein